MFVMRVSASGRGFHRIYPTQSQESFFDGHVRAFDRFGGIPERIRYDNLKPAVARVLKGRDRTETARFVALRSQYGSTPSSAGPAPRGLLRREAWRATWAASDDVTWCRFPTWPTWASSTRP